MGKDADHELVLLLRLRLEHVLAVVAVEEELTGFGVRDKLDKVVVACFTKTPERCAKFNEEYRQMRCGLQ